MHFEGRRRASTTPNLTPLIDVVFLLLVFFMLTSHFVKEDTIKVDLPQTESGAPLKDQRQVKVVLDDHGRALIHEHYIEPDALADTLRRELEGTRDKVVRIRGDKAAALGAAVHVLDAARKAGAKGVDIVTEEK